MGVVSKLKKYIADQEATAEVEANNRETIEKAEREAYEKEKERRRKEAEAEAKQRKEEAKQKAIDEARQRGKEQAKPLAQKIDERIAQAGTVAHRAVKTTGKVAKATGKTAAGVMDATGQVAKAALKAEQDVVAEMQSVSRRARKQSPKKAKPRRVAAPQVVVVRADGTVQGTRRSSAPSKSQNRARSNPLAKPQRTLAIGGKGYPVQKSKPITFARGQGQPTSKKTPGKRFGTR